MASTRTCQQCRAPLPEDTPGGLCVPCLLRLGLTPPEDDPAESAADDAGAAAPPPELAELAGEFADYRVLELLGEGGCGRVYRAEHLRPVRREVALKVIKLGMDTRQVIARFEAERQALALMDHPNIAKVLGAGATRGGWPFFVMELVRGPRITQFCDEHRLAPAQRLELFVQVCHAVQHAHQKGIIHRDLKSSNVLVALQHGVPVPKVIDFGIAKATGGLDLTDKTLFTAFEQFLGTPAYMSPELAGLGRTDVDTRSDIYSLGVLLYELLTGRPPFDAQELLRRGIEEVFLTIRETEPPKPSTRLGMLTVADLTRVARARGLEPPRLLGAVRGDLDWIVMKALEKDRARRYETANGLAMDLRRHLQNEPVMARPQSGLYRLQKTAHRHRTAFAAGAVVLVALLLALAVSTRALRHERLARAQAQAAAHEARSVLDFLQTRIIAAARPASEPGGLGREVTVIQALEQAERLIEDSFAGQPLVEAALREAMGATYVQLGQYAQAARHHRRAHTLRAKHLGPAHPVTLQSLVAWANTLQVGGSPGESVALWRQAHAAAARPRPRDRHTLELLCAVGIAERDANRLEDSNATLQRALAQARSMLGPGDALTIDTLNAIGYNYWLQHRPKEAAAALEEVLARRRELNGPEHADTTRAMIDLARVYQAQGRWEQARPILQEALAIRERVHGEAHAQTLVALDAVAAGFARAGQWSEAAAHAERAGRLRESRLGPDHLDTIRARMACAAFRIESVWIGRAATPAVASAAQARQALDDLEHYVAVCDKGYPHGHRSQIEPRCLLGAALAVLAAVDTAAPTADRLATLTRAEQTLLDCWTAYTEGEAVSAEYKLEAATQLARLYEVWPTVAPEADKTAEAAHWRKQAEALRPVPPSASPTR